MRREARLAAAAATVAVALGCGDGGAFGPAKTLDGDWGATGASLKVGAGSAVLELDCAHGAFPAPATLEDGRFAAEGTYAREGGPTPEGGEPPVSARYSGTAVDGRLSLTIQVAGFDEPIGPLVLVRGRRPILRKCL